MNIYGLLGRNISYSFSRSYFAEKFQKEGILAQYLNFDMQDLSQFSEVLEDHPDLRGLNVTIPYKEDVIHLLDDLDPVAQEIGAVNTIKLSPDGLKGYNTDYFGFRESLRPHLEPQHQKALILGTGGASKAIEYALASLGIATLKVSRKKGNHCIIYDQLDAPILGEHALIINCTPLGTHPHTEQMPKLPTDFLGPQHLVYDLIYNPSKTALMHQAESKGARVLNGHQMLVLQAEEAWRIWTR